MARQIMRIDLTGPAKRQVGILSDKHGMTQLVMMSRLVDWLARQDKETLSDIVQCPPVDITIKMLKRMAG